MKAPPISRALLVIDVQNEYFTGALPITHPVGHLQQILKAMDAAAKTPVVVIQHTFAKPQPPTFQKGAPALGTASRGGGPAARSAD